jgi:hypothetical protein
MIGLISTFKTGHLFQLSVFNSQDFGVLARLELGEREAARESVHVDD